MGQVIRIWATLLMIASLSACTTIQLEPLPAGMTDQPPADWQARSAKLRQFNHWQLSGKLAVRQPSDSGTAIINYWKQDGEAYDLALSSSFLGMGSTNLKGVPGFIELTLSNGETYRSGDPDALMKAATGWQLPLESLTWWIRGLPAPGGDFRLLFDDRGELAMIRQAGWEIRYDRWHELQGDIPALPARITALKEDKRVRVVVSNWQDLNP
ncbi:MAG: outer membrane lipoprotein LolB [Marinobacter sp.]|uniref:lipoprotein insertase outer membrane protein LolB n=1 Tax=Marinobacter sp. TaxID=50741 RepID=UPI001B4918B1|nr:lipoprotein insertase outer membrane protein LolB [Marinobacter sp.]MBQ0746619.1 outer membrane lipoprotein LolB [Marinobacter sp.]MBQ0815797.1 outer membrane lipoprotein LolB [Marinobacter sp.]|tara:strand:- start:6598 stop:7233 length:636 start_codon:yes stop_codon:yes gene_type:complete